MSWLNHEVLQKASVSTKIVFVSLKGNEHESPLIFLRSSSTVSNECSTKSAPSKAEKDIVVRVK